MASSKSNTPGCGVSSKVEFGGVVIGLVALSEANTLGYGVMSKAEFGGEVCKVKSILESGGSLGARPPVAFFLLLLLS